MKYKPLLLVVLVLSLAVLACGVSIDLPITDVKTGPTVTEDIRIDFPATSEMLDVDIEFGAGELNLQPGAERALIEGVVKYNIPDFKPEITINNNNVRLATGDLEITGFPTFDDKYKNEWKLQLANVPMNLTISAGAYKSEIELGGLSLQSLEVMDGAADVDIRFSEPNLVPMDTLRYQTGASSVSLRGLANAGCDRLIFKGGAGDYTLDFSGVLQRDMDVSIDSGMSSLAIIIPRGVPVEVRFDGGLSNVDYSGDWQRSGDDYYQEGSGPEIIINVNIGAGSLRLRNR